MPNSKNSQTKIILGIDPGIARVGFAFLKKIDGHTQEVITYGCLTTTPKTPTQDRLITIHHKLQKLIKQNKPEVMVVEKLFFNSNAKTAIIVGQAIGAILLTGAQAELEISQLTPLQIKQGITGYGRADKRQIQQMVMGLLDLEEKPTPDDAADALAIALCYAIRNPALDPVAV